MDEIEVLYKTLNKAKSIWNQCKNFTSNENLTSYFVANMQSFLDNEIGSEIAIRTNITKSELISDTFVFHIHTRISKIDQWSKTEFVLR